MLDHFGHVHPLNLWTAACCSSSIHGSSRQKIMSQHTETNIPKINYAGCWSPSCLISCDSMDYTFQRFSYALLSPSSAQFTASVTVHFSETPMKSQHAEASYPSSISVFTSKLCPLESGDIQLSHSLSSPAPSYQFLQHQVFFNRIALSSGRPKYWHISHIRNQ